MPGESHESWPDYADHPDLYATTTLPLALRDLALAAAGAAGLAALLWAILRLWL